MVLLLIASERAPSRLPDSIRAITRRRFLRQNSVYSGNEPVHLMLEIDSAVNVYGGAIRDLAHFAGKILGGRHGCTIQQYGNDRNAFLKRGFNFDPDPILPFLKQGRDGWQPHGDVSEPKAERDQDDVFQILQP